MQYLRFLLALWAGKAAALAINIIAKGRGTNKPGQIALKIDPNFIAHFRNLKPERTIFVTGTNGKSTITNLLAHIFQTDGQAVAANLEGANLMSGVAVALMKNASLGGKIKKDLVLLETDERSLIPLSKQLKARHVCITNIQKDQVQRNAEPDYILRKLKTVLQTLGPATALYLNNEEPNAKSLASLTDKPVYYGVERNSRSFTKEGFYKITLPCPVCGHKVEFDYYNIDNVGRFHCTHCDLQSEAEPQYLVHGIDFEQQRFRLGDRGYHLAYEAQHFLYCYSAALAIARELGVTPEVIEKACASFVNISGRFDIFHVGTKTVRYLRMKQENPETLQSALNYIALDPKEKIFVLGLEEITDTHPHYTNAFYAYDCDFEQLIGSNVVRYISFSNTVCYDTAMRLIYDGVDPELISVIDNNCDLDVLTELDKYDCDNVYLITLLGKYEDLAAYAARHYPARERAVAEAAGS